MLGNRLLVVSRRTTRHRPWFVSSLRSLHSNAALDEPQDEHNDTMHTQVYSSLSGTHEPMDYVRGWAWQQVLLQDRLQLRRRQRQEETTDNDMILLFEHTPVYTLGRGAKEEHLTFLQDTKCQETLDQLSRTNHDYRSARLVMNQQRLELLLDPNTNRHFIVENLVDSACPVHAPNHVPIYRVERGGEVTFHGPGQLVVYPLLDLTKHPYKQDLHWYLRQMEQVIIEVLQEFGIYATRNDDYTGVWVDHQKIAAVGVGSSKWITTHGFSINVTCDLQYFDTSIIMPCGIDQEGLGVTCVEQVLKENKTTPQKVPSVQNVAKVVVAKMQNVFGMTIHQDEHCLGQPISDAQ